MAARLNGSQSSIDSSFTSASASMDRCSVDQSQDGSKSMSDSITQSRDSKQNASDKPGRYTGGKRQTADKTTDSSVNKTKPSPKRNTNPNSKSKLVDPLWADEECHHRDNKPPSAIPGHLTAPENTKNFKAGSKPSSPYFSDEDNACMLDQLRKINK